MLDKPTKERLFEEHIRGLKKKRHDQLTSILDEMTSITVGTRWGDAKRLLREEERVQNMYGKDERVRFIDLID